MTEKILNNHGISGILLCTVTLFIFASHSFAETNAETSTNAVRQSSIDSFGIGFKVDANFNQLPNDLRFGLSVNTPYLFDLAALRFEIDQGFIRGVPATSLVSNTLWADYTDYKMGLILVASLKTKVIRPYIETGFIWVYPSDVFTINKYSWGIYGLLGFEIKFPGDFLAFYLELGGAGLFQGDQAEKFAGSPHYVTGTTVSLGLRYYFPDLFK